MNLEPFNLRKAREQLLDRFAEVNLLDVMPLIEKQDMEFVLRLKERSNNQGFIKYILVKDLEELAGITQNKSSKKGDDVCKCRHDRADHMIDGCEICECSCFSLDKHENP